METKNNINEEAGNILSGINKENFFSTPKDYFDYLPQEISEKIHSSSRKKPSFVLKPSVALASFTTLCAAVFFLLYYSQTSIISPQELSLSDNDIQLIIENPEKYNINETIITDQYLSLNIQDDENANQLTEINVSDDEIKNYIEDNTDINTIINNL